MLTLRKVQYMLPTVEEILEIFQWGDQEQKVAFIDSCSIILFKDLARQAAENEPTLENSCQLLDFLSRACLESEQFGLVERISESCYLLARSSCDLILGDTFMLRLFAGRATLNWITALQLQGDYIQIAQLIDEPLKWLKDSGDAGNFYLLSLKKVESLLDQDSYLDAKKAFKKIEESKLSAKARVQYRTIEYRIRIRTSKKAQLPIDFSEPESVDEDASKYYTGYIDVNEALVRKKLLGASYLLADSKKGMDRDEILKIEPDLLNGRDWMKDHNFSATENDACWSLYLAYNRTNREELAVEQLQRIRSNTEQVRSKISDPAARTRLAERFPFLYACLCTLFYKLGRYEELLEVIEASKSRTQADMVTRISDKPSTEREFTKGIEELPKIMGRLHAHYCTFFVDDDCIYCVIVTAAGKIRASKINIKRVSLIQYVPNRNPEEWSQSDLDLPEELSPISELIKYLLQKRELKQGDHICYSAHDALLNFPYQYISFKGEHLVDYFSMSQIPGAFFLLQFVKRNPVNLKRYVQIEVPSIQEGAVPEAIESISEPGQSLKYLLKEGVKLEGEDADLDKLVKTDLEGSVVHFSVHGKQPANRVRANSDSYRSSGLIIASRNKLPDLALIDKGIGGEHLLSPEKILNQEISFSNSHITLQDSVDGPSERGRGGFPPGLEWAFLQNGASSILSANWPCSAESKTLFLKLFYKNWLEDGYSRAEAWRLTVIELKYSTLDSDPSLWAAYSLIGDWR
jgi:CHAT domain-containing protein